MCILTYQLGGGAGGGKAPIPPTSKRTPEKSTQIKVKTCKQHKRLVVMDIQT